MPDQKQKTEATKWLKRIKKEPMLVQRVKLIRDAALKIRELEAVINTLACEIDDHDPLLSLRTQVPLGRYVPMPRDMQMNGFHWWDYAPIELGDDSEAGFLKALAFAFAFSEESALAERDRHR